MFYKSVHGQEPQGAMVQRQPSSDDARDASSNADLIERVLAVVSRMEREVGRVDDWIGGWTGWLRGG